MTIPPIARRLAQAYLAVEIKEQKDLRVLLEEAPMLYIFARNNSLQIAWDSKAPRRQPESRSQQLDTRPGLFGYIRTYSAG